MSRRQNADGDLRAAWVSHVASGSVRGSLEALDALLARHREPARSYHTELHVWWVIHHGVSIAANHPEVDLGHVVAAAFFHDAIYDATRSDNELQSSELAGRVLVDLGWDASASSHVEAMILATAGHRPDDDLATAILLASDLGILAAAPATYLDYVGRVRDEYAHVDDESWQIGRGAVLRSFLDLGAIFDDRVAPTCWEARARSNLTAELAVLEGGSPLA